MALSAALLDLRRHSEASDAADRGLAIDPASFRLRQLKIVSSLARGDLEGARATLAAVPRDVDQAALVAYLATYNDLFWVLTDVQQTLVLTLPPSAYDGNDRATWGAVRMQTYWLRGDKARARLYADSARIAYLAQLRDAPDDPQLHILLALTLGYLGDRGAAIREANQGIAAAQGSPNEAYFRHQAARMYVLIGEPEKAVDELEVVLRMPYLLAPGTLRVDPAFTPLKGNPRFDRLAAGS
jgi:tetratricopeptide (TPR) repeat protein